jgi:hypothetical protein
MRAYEKHGVAGLPVTRTQTYGDLRREWLVVACRQAGMRLRDPGTLERALADLIEHRETTISLLAARDALDRMIGDIQAEIDPRCRGKVTPAG